jgi:hypothetical protein
MPLPALPPLVLAAAKYGTVALAAWALTRETYRGRIDQRAEDAFDDLPEGLSIRQPADRVQTNLAARMKRRVALGAAGIELDLAILARLRLRRS